MTKGYVFSLFDFTGHAVRPWAEEGYTCYCLDILHDGTKSPERFKGMGSIHYIPADLNPGAGGWLWATDVMQEIVDNGGNVAMVMGFPPCDDLTSSGARHFASKAEANPEFQMVAVERAKMVQRLADRHNVPWFVENPIGRLSTLWRKPDAYWEPYQFGGYILPSQAAHPDYPDYIAPQDAYTKRSGLWFGNGFRMPLPIAVKPEILERTTKSGKVLRGSRQFMKLGGKSLKTKTIRNATPRGFARAVLFWNAPGPNGEMAQVPQAA